ncbi:hypothetical protein E9Z77_000697 [Escherichia coli]|nr:hypothetical protein [Escherichia coli]
MGTDTADAVAARNSYGRGSYSFAGGCAVFCCPGWLSVWWHMLRLLLCAVRFPRVMLRCAHFQAH